MSPPNTRKCKIKNRWTGRTCNDTAELYIEGSGKMDVYYCNTHGLIGVMKEFKRKEMGRR